MRELDRHTLGTLSVTVAAGHDAIWIITRRDDQGGTAMRAAFLPAGYGDVRPIRRHAGEVARIARQCGTP